MYKITNRYYMVFLCIFTLISCSEDSLIEDGNTAIKTANLVDYAAYSAIEADILAAVNSHRVAIGLNTLKKVDDITYQASEHNLYMIKQKEVSHDNFSQRYNYLVKEIGAKAVSENVGYGYRTADAVVRAWVNSEAHRKNIEGEFTHFGISVDQDEEGKNYFTNIFVRR